MVSCCLGLFVTPAVFALAAAPAEDDYALSPPLTQLEKDVASEAYRKIIGAFIHTELAPELARLDVADNAERFLAARGGQGALEANAALRAAYERRQRIEAAFVALLRAEYVRLGREEALAKDLAALRGAGRSTTPAAEVAVLPLAIEPILPAPGAGGEWPRWRGPSGQGSSREKGLPVEWSATQNLAWKAAIPGDGNSSPVIWGESLFLLTAFDKGRRRSLVSVRCADGEVAWVADAPFAEPEGQVRDKNGYASSTPATDGERVVGFFGNAGLAAFDFSGKLLWHRPLEPFQAMHGTGASVVLCGDLAILFQEQSAKPSIGIAADKRTGEVRWLLERGRALGWCTPLALRVGGRDEIVYGGNGVLTAYDPPSGKVLWTCRGTTEEVVPSVAYGHGLLFCASGRNGPTLAVRPGGEGDVTDTRLAWRALRGGPHVPSPVLVDDLLYLLNDTGIVTCLEARTGKLIFQQRLRGRFSASPVAADGKVYFTNEEGDTFVARAGREMEVLRVNSLGEEVLASAAILRGRIYIRGRRHLFAIGISRGAFAKPPRCRGEATAASPQ